MRGTLTEAKGAPRKTLMATRIVPRARSAASATTPIRPAYAPIELVVIQCRKRTMIGGVHESTVPAALRQGNGCYRPLRRKYRLEVQHE